MTARIWHPAIHGESGDGYAEVDDSAVAQHRQSGWLLASERDEHEAAVAAHPSNQADDETSSEDASADPGGKPKSRRAAGSGTEGSE